jgi:hypothetical protein
MADDKDDIKKKTQETAEIVGDAFRRISENIKDIFDEALDGADNFAKSLQKDITRSLNQIAKSSSRLLTENEEKLNRGALTRTQIDKQILNLNSKLKALEIEKNIAIKNGLVDEQEINKQYAQAVEYNKELVNELQEQIKQSDTIKNKLGLTGALIKGISKIPFLKDIVDADKALSEAAKSSSKIGAAFTALKSVSKDILKFLVDPLTFLLAVFDIDKEIGKLAKGLDLSYTSAANLRKELTDIANASGDTAVTTKGLQESLLAVGTQMGINARLSAQDLVTFTKLREQAGYTNDELIAIQKISTINNKTVEDTSKAFLGTVARLNAQNKLAINAKQLFKEIVNVSDAIKLSVGGTAEKIAEAAFKAKQFGINLNQADQISESLLNFETSINNQISAELITGKELNMDKARLLALNGDIAGASAEILKQVGGTAEFTKMNRIQQEALAKAVGLSRDDLAKSLIDREVAVKLGAKEGQSAQDRYNQLVKQYGIEKANAMLGDEALARQFQQQSAQERFTQAIEKLKEIFVTIAEPLMPVLDMLANIFKVIGVAIQPILYVFQAITGVITGNLKELSTTQKVIGTIVASLGAAYVVFKSIVAIQKTWNALTLAYNLMKAFGNKQEKEGILLSLRKFAVDKGRAIANAIAGAWESYGPVPFIGAALAAAAAIAGVAYINSQAKVQDGMISPDGGLVVSGAKGTYKLDPNDHVIAGTDLGKKTPAAGGGGGQDISSLLNEMKALRQEQAKSNSKPTIVENSMNGTKFGTSVAMNTYKTQ